MLELPYIWIDSECGSYLRRNAGGVATVVKKGDKWLTRISRRNDTTLEAIAATREQGKRWV